MNDSARVPRRFTNLSWFILLVVVAVRPLISETYDSSRTALSAALQEIADPLPAVTLMFDAAIIAAAVVWLTARLLAGGLSYRETGLEWGALLVAAGGVISCCVAGNKRVAINATADWLCLALLTVILVQVLRDRRRIHLTLCVILASAAVQAFECYNQVYDSFPETQRLYEQTKDARWKAAGVEPDSPQIELYERRLYGREATGYLTHSNVAGGYLATTALAALALGWAAWRSHRPSRLSKSAIAPAILALAMIGAALLTGSRGAWVAGAVGAAVWIVRLMADRWFTEHRKRALQLGWAAVALATFVCIGHGLYHGSLPGASLNFRWQYWTTSASVFADHWLTGVGRENFSAHYLQYKPITAPEEVSNPHNFLVQAATEWGVLGVAGMLVMLVGGSIVVTRPGTLGKPADVKSPNSGPSPLRWGTAICLTAFLVRLPLLGSQQPAYVLYVTALPLLVWALAFALLCRGRLELGAMSWLAAGINCSLLVFLLQDTINFALFVPGAATTFFALLAIPIALRPESIRDDTKPGGRLWIAPLAAGLILVVFLVLAVIPVTRSGLALRRGREQAAYPLPCGFAEQSIYRSFMDAAGADSLDPTPRAEAAAYLIGYADLASDAAAIGRAFVLIDDAIALDPYRTALYRQKAQMCNRAYTATGDVQYLELEVAANRRIVELYAQSPPAHADLGAALLKLGRQSGDRQPLIDARHHLARALELDNSRPAWEELRRFPSSKIETIRRLASEVHNLLHDNGGGSTGN